MDLLSSLSGLGTPPASYGAPVGGNDPLAAIGGQLMQGATQGIEPNPLLGLLVNDYKRQQNEAYTTQAAQREAAGAMGSATKGSYGAIAPVVGAGIQGYNAEYDAAVKAQQLEQLKLAQMQQNFLKQQELNQWRQQSQQLQQERLTETERYHQDLLAQRKQGHWQRIVQPDDSVVEYNVDTGETRETGIKARKSLAGEQGSLTWSYEPDPNDPTGIAQIKVPRWVKPDGSLSDIHPARSATVTQFLERNQDMLNVTSDISKRLDSVIESGVSNATVSAMASLYNLKGWPAGGAVGAIGDSVVQGWSGLTDAQKQNLTDMFAEIGRLTKDIGSSSGAGRISQRVYDDFIKHVGNIYNDPKTIKEKLTEVRKAMQDEQDVRLGRRSAAGRLGADSSTQPDESPPASTPVPKPQAQVFTMPSGHVVTPAEYKQWWDSHDGPMDQMTPEEYGRAYQAQGQ